MLLLNSIEAILLAPRGQVPQTTHLHKQNYLQGKKKNIFNLKKKLCISIYKQQNYNRLREGLPKQKPEPSPKTRYPREFSS
jgi:hypothetical protein